MFPFARKILSRQDLREISTKIAEVEKETSGEIRVAIFHRRRRKEKHLSLHEVALSEFRRLGMHNTKHKTGVLIMLLYAERKFHIIADEGIHKKVQDGTWERIAETLSKHFARGKFKDGICEAVAAVGEELSRHFPKQPGDTDELPNKVVEE